MLESMEGRRGMPRLKPPFPSSFGYLGRPTLINNVETLAHVPAILREGGAAWAARGVNGARGVRLWSVTGAVASPGCYEAPNGISLRALIDDYAGGDGGDRRGRPGRGRERHPAAGRARRTPDARGPRAVGRRARLGGACRSSRRRTRSCGCWRRRCASSPRSRARSARRAGSATGRCTISWSGSTSTARAAMPRAQVEEWLDAMAETSICGLGQGGPIPMRGAFRHWPELFEPLGVSFPPRTTSTARWMVEFTMRAASTPGASCSSAAPPATASSVPTLGHDEQLEPYGGCRMCVVERRGLAAPAARLRDARSRGDGRLDQPRPAASTTLTEMLLSEHLNASRAAGPTSSSTSPMSSAPRRRSSSRTRAEAVRRPQPADGLRP